VWSIDLIDDRRPGAQRFAVLRGSAPATYSDVVDAWRGDSSFRARLSSVLAAAHYSAFRWETPPVTTATARRPFEFVLLDSPGLAHQPDAGAFADHFDGTSERDVVSFPNLGGDAILVVPRPIAAASAYGHMAAFVRHAPEPQKHALWQAVGEAMASRLGTKPVWLSTAGAGVSWLHVRLDDRPKYYGFAPYRIPP
jgi:hypothetical protein